MKKYSLITKGNSRQTSRNKKLKQLAIIAGVALVLFYVASRLMGGLAAFVFEPIIHTETALFDISSLAPAYVTDRAALVDEITALKKEVREVGGNVNAVSLLRKENAALRTLLGRGTSTRIVAGVIGRPTETPYDVLVIDVGTDDGVTEHAPVFMSENQAIGYVVRAYARSSLVQLVTAPGVESTVYIFGPDIYTTARGEGGGVLRVSVPQGITLAEGDMVVLPSLGSGVFGTINYIESTPTEPEQRGYVTLDISLQGLRFLSVGDAALSTLSFEEAVEVVGMARTDLTKVPVPSGILVDTVSTSTATSTDSDSASTTVSDEIEILESESVDE